MNQNSFSESDEKAKRLLEKVADDYRPPSMDIGDAEKYYWPVVIARYEIYGTGDSLANAYIKKLGERSPFHFTLVGMARIMSKYHDSEIITSSKADILQKVFDRDDSMNAWYAEGTENHINMSKTSGYLFAQHALQFPELFPDADAKMEMLKEWMKWWSQQIYQTGTGEWNSSIYQAYNIMGWLNLYDFAEDAEVRNLARAVLDFYATEMALHYSFGLTGGPEMRGVGVNLDGRSATAYFNWLWFSEDTQPLNGFKGSQFIQTVHAATSNYRPHRVIRDFSTDKPRQPANYWESRPSYNFEEPSFAKINYHVDEKFTIGNCVSNYGGFLGGTYQMVPWKMVIENSPVPHVVSGNGVYFNNYSGKTRNPYTQSVQHENVIVQLTMVPEDAEERVAKIDETVAWWSDSMKHDLKLRYPTETYRIETDVVNAPSNRNFENRSFISLPEAFQHYEKNEGHVFEVNGDMFLLVNSLNPSNDTVYNKNGRNILETSADYGFACGFAVEVVKNPGQESIPSIDIESGRDFVRYTSFSGDILKMDYNQRGKYIEPLFDWGYGPTEPQTKSTSPPFLQPNWESCNTCGRVPSLWVNEEPVDYQSHWPVFDGPGLRLDKGILEISHESDVYRIDYSGDEPVFEE